MADQTIKDQVLEAMKRLPADATIEDAMERLYVLGKVLRGLEQSERGDTMSHEEAVRRLTR
jgi:hypothetical protein